MIHPLVTERYVFLDPWPVRACLRRKPMCCRSAPRITTSRRRSICMSWGRVKLTRKGESRVGVPVRFEQWRDIRRRAVPHVRYLNVAGTTFYTFYETPRAESSERQAFKRQMAGYDGRLTNLRFNPLEENLSERDGKIYIRSLMRNVVKHTLHRVIMD